MAHSNAHGSISNAAAEQSARTGLTPEELAAEAGSPEPGKDVDPDAGTVDGETEAAAEARRAGHEQGPAKDSEPDAGTETDHRPAQGDPKAAWVDYAVTQGVAREDAEAMTKAALIDAHTD